MALLACPHCKKINPGEATYCYFDGILLRGSGSAAAPGSLAQEFYFPSGRRCRTFDELVAGCQEEWQAARDLLKQGVFQQYFTSAGRLDLVRASKEASAQADPDIGLTNFLSTLPASTTAKGPKLDVNPRRLNVGKVMGGETRKIQLKILNVGQGVLQGTLSVTEGKEWLHLSTGPGGNGQIAIKTPREQAIPLLIDTRELAAGEPYAGKIRIITNGGVEEIAVRIDVGARPFPRPPFQGARSPREMAHKMKDNPKAAVALLESGELPKWFGGNGWNYPVGGTPAPGVAGVQQFFEAMGLAKPPVIQVSPPEVRLLCRVPDRSRVTVKLTAAAKKWVYANVVCDVPWLKVLTPAVAGPQHTMVALEIEPRYLPAGKHTETVVQLIVNGGQKLRLPVRVEIQRPTAAPVLKVAASLVLMAFTFFLFRLLVSPLVDIYARSTAVQYAANRSVTPPVAAGSPVTSVAGWLQLSWPSILLGQSPTFPDGYFGDLPGQGINPENLENFRDFFVSNFVWNFVALTWWIGAIAGAIFLLRKNGVKDGIWGLFSGAVLGVVVTATLACMLLLVDLVPGLLWCLFLGTAGSQGPANLGHLLLWIVLAVLWWTALGGGLGLVLKILGPVGRPFLIPVQETFAGFFRLLGLRGLANLCASQ